MSIDERPPVVEHADLRRCDDLERLYEDRAARLAEDEREWRHQQEAESVEAMEAHWQGAFAADPLRTSLEFGYADGVLPVAARGPHDR